MLSGLIYFKQFLILNFFNYFVEISWSLKRNVLFCVYYLVDLVKSLDKNVMVMSNQKLVISILITVLVIIVGTSFRTIKINNNDNGIGVYKANCLVCHGATGAGLPGAFPPLEKSDYLERLSKNEAITIVLKGLTGEITVNGQKFNSVMAPLGRLSDQDVSDVLNYISDNLGNNLNKNYIASDVEKVRETLNKN